MLLASSLEKGSVVGVSVQATSNQSCLILVLYLAFYRLLLLGFSHTGSAAVHGCDGSNAAHSASSLG